MTNCPQNHDALSCVHISTDNDGCPRLNLFSNGELSTALNANFNIIAKTLTRLSNVVATLFDAVVTLGDPLIVEGDVTSKYATDDTIYVYDNLCNLVGSYTVVDSTLVTGNTHVDVGESVTQGTFVSDAPLF